MQPSHPLRVWLVLGRASNLPTVWSNCLAGWLLGDGGNDWFRFGLLCLGATLLYTGGMYLNDAFDAGFDAQHRRERPIPSGIVSAQAVWSAGGACLLAGLAVLWPMNGMTAATALLLVGCILVYDAVHKLVTFSPVLMAFCRFFLYLTAAAAAGGRLTGPAMWSAIALAVYVAGLSWVARRESTGVTIQLWPLFLLLAPPALAVVVNWGSVKEVALPGIAILMLWVIRSLRSALSEPRNVGRAVSGMLAGIVWVDWLAVADQTKLIGGVFLALFALALLFQRFVPAT